MAMAASCEDGNEYSFSTKDGKFIACLKDLHFFKKGSDYGVGNGYVKSNDYLGVDAKFLTGFSECELDSDSSKDGPTASSCRHGNEISDYTKKNNTRNFFDN
jgi:hypothetical protein